MTALGGDDGHDGGERPGAGIAPLTEHDPRRIGRFALLGRLGSGGMGRVFLGTADGRLAAVKQVHPHLTEDREFLRRFGHELDNLARLPAGVSAALLDSDREAQPPWLATEFIPGVTLDEALELNGGPLPAPDVWLLLRAAAAGLSAVHETGVVHRDLKPSNVMLRPDGVTLIDFGVARALEQSRLTQSGMVIGTPAYMSPEQASSRRNVTAETDVFALGCLLGYAATGLPPYGDAGGVQMLYRIVHEEPDLEPLRAVDASLAEVVGDCLARDPQERPTSAEVVARAEGQVVDATPAPWPAAVRERLVLRAETTQRLPAAAAEAAALEVGTSTGSAAADGAKGVAGATGIAGAAGAAGSGEPAVVLPSEPERRRRRLMPVVVVPLLVVATGGAVALLPYLQGPRSGGGIGLGAGGTSSAVATAGTASARPSAPASSTSPGVSPSRTAGGGPGGGASPSGAPRGVGGTPGSGSSGGPSSTSGSGVTSGTTGGTNSGTGTPGGHGGVGGTSGSGSGTGGGVSASGTHRLRSALNGQCLVADLNHSTSGYLAACGSGSSQQWTYLGGSGGTFELRNGGTGTCLAGSASNYTYLVSCGSSDADVWRFRSSAAGGATVENPAAGQCLQNGTVYGGYAVTTGCGSTADLVWSND